MFIDLMASYDVARPMKWRAVPTRPYQVEHGHFILTLHKHLAVRHGVVVSDVLEVVHALAGGSLRKSIRQISEHDCLQGDCS